MCYNQRRTYLGGLYKLRGLKKLSKNCYGMTNEKNNIDINVYLTESLLEDLKGDDSLDQLYDATHVPGVLSPVVGMPDIHSGYGLPIGGVMATDYETGAVSAGAVGMDINCGVRLITTNIHCETLDKDTLSKILSAIIRRVPLGVGKGSKIKRLRSPDLEAIAAEGAGFYVKEGFGRKEDLERIEDHGCIKGADVSSLSQATMKRADQLGTIGGGNHFIEIGRVSKVFDEDIAKQFGIPHKSIYILIHTGSRGFGHQVCTEYSNIMWRNSNKNKTKAPVKGLACAPIFSEDGQNYLKAMACAANYAFANRQVITHFVRESFVEVLKKHESDLGLDLLYDVAHNIAKKEKYDDKWALVHRKGATRALPAGHDANPEIYKKTGHPAIIPGSMGTGSYVILGTPNITKTYCSVNHGAGRVMSRNKARRNISKEELLQQTKNVILPARNIKALLDEAPQAYKDIDEVIFALVDANLTKPIVKLRPMGVLKGEK